MFIAWWTLLGPRLGRLSSRRRWMRRIGAAGRTAAWACGRYSYFKNGAGSGDSVWPGGRISPGEAAAAEGVDILQIPAFLCRQTDLLVAAGRTGRALNIKKGQFVSPGDIAHAAEKVASTGNHNIILTRARIFVFALTTFVVDMRGLKIMAQTGCSGCFRRDAQ